MNKIKSFPAIASLVLRLAVSIPYLYIAYESIGELSGQPWYSLALFGIITVASVFILIGFLTRWATLTWIAYYVIAAIAIYHANVLLIVLGLFQGTSVVALVAIWLLNSGMYSVDYLIWKKRNTMPIPSVTPIV